MTEDARGPKRLGQVPVPTKEVTGYTLEEVDPVRFVAKVASTHDRFVVPGEWARFHLSPGNETWYVEVEHAPWSDRLALKARLQVKSQDQYRELHQLLVGAPYLGQEPVVDREWVPFDSAPGVDVYALRWAGRHGSRGDSDIANRFAIGFGMTSSPRSLKVCWFREQSIEPPWTPFWSITDGRGESYDPEVGDWVEFERVSPGVAGYPARGTWQQITSTFTPPHH